MKLSSLLTVLLLLVTANLRAADDVKPAKDNFNPTELPVRALMLYGVPPSALESFLKFVREDLPREGVNTLIFQIDYNYQYKSRPELVADGAYTEEQIKLVVRACREAGVKLIPLLNCLGHQSWAKATHKLLTVYPDFDETKDLYPDNKDIYCRSYCPNHPEVHKVIFDLLGEITAVFETDAVHVGMDEVFLIGEKNCPRCKGLDKAELFAQEIRTLRDFLKTKNAKLWLWGDRFLDGRVTGVGEWEGSFNNTHRAIDLVPKDIVICDWHYEAAVPTASYFALKGFNVISCSWNKPHVAMGHVDEMVRVRTANRANKQFAPRLLGVMATNWGKSGSFADSYRTAKATGAKADSPAVENFIRLFEYVRKVSAPIVEPAAAAATKSDK